jgi:RimJ/RimL family protein N-acetyltransferase
MHAERRHMDEGTDVVPLIVTERLVLRDFEAEDWPDAHDYRSGPEVARLLLTHHPESPEQTRAWLQRVIEERQRQPRARYTLAIVLPAEGSVIGQVSIGTGRDYPAPGELGIGYMLGRPSWGRGYASEADRAVVRLGFAMLGARQLSAWCAEENRASARVLEKAGPQLECREEGVRPKTGQVAASLRYTIHRADWAAGPGRDGA